MSSPVIFGLIIGSITLLFFILRQLKLEQPILEFRIFSYKVFSLSTILGMITFMAMIGTAVIVPLLMQNMLGYSAFESGLALLPGALIMGFMNPITGRLFDKFGASYLAIIGLTILTIAATFMFTIIHGETPFLYIVLVNAFRMLGISMVMMPVTTAGLNELPIHLISHGSAMNNTMRQVAGSIGTALLVTVMTTTARYDEGVDGLIQGVNTSFFVAGIFSFIALLLSFAIQNPKRMKENEK